MRPLRRIPVAMGLAVAAVLAMTVLVPGTPVWKAVDNAWLDQLVRWRAADQAGDPAITIVAIDEYSIRAMREVAGSWPWPRSVHAELVDALMDAGAAAVIFDVSFPEPDRYRPDHDAYFSEVLDARDRVFLPVTMLFGGEPERLRAAGEYPASLQLEPMPGADPDARLDVVVPAVGSPEHWQTGSINFTPDADGRSRRYPLYLEQRGWRLPSLPARVLRDVVGTEPPGVAIRIDWRGTADPPYITHAYADLYEKLLAGDRLDADRFRDRWVLVGATATGLHDLRATPMGAYVPGVYILANVLDNLKNGDRLAAWGEGLPWLPPLVIVAALILAGLSRMRLVGLLVLLGVLTAAGFAASGLAARQGILVPVASALTWAWLVFLGLAVLRYWREYQARRQALDLFGRFLDPNVVGELAAAGMVERSMNARETEITVLFSDIRGFTTLSESRSAEQIMTLLNRYFDRQVAVIFDHQGTLDKFIGDAIMAFWGAPVATGDHARRAVAAALDMAENLETFRTQAGDDAFDIGIGVHTGPAVVGMLGSEQRYDYTAIGDTVNLASRIEGLTRDRARVLVSAATRDACGGDAFDFIERGWYTVKGRKGEVAVFEPRRRTT